MGGLMSEPEHLQETVMKEMLLQAQGSSSAEQEKNHYALGKSGVRKTLQSLILAFLQINTSTLLTVLN